MAHSESRDVKARKDHRCAWCWEVIKKGEVYHLTEWVSANEHGRDRMHQCCAAAVRAMDSGDMADWIDWGCQPYYQKGHTHEPDGGELYHGCPGCKHDKELAELAADEGVK